MNRAKRTLPKKRIVFAEGEETKIIRAAAQIQAEEIAEPILIGRSNIIREKIETLGLESQPKVIDPETFARAEEYANAYFALRQRKGMSQGHATAAIHDPMVLGALMVKMGDADCFVAGLAHAYPEVIRPALQIHHTRAGVRKAAGVYIMIVDDRVYLFTDATVNIEPTAEDLAEIAALAADFGKEIGLEPRIAFLSFSNFGSTKHPASDKVQRAVELLHQKRPDLRADGEMQADTAVVPEIIEQRFPFSTVKDANVLVFPSLESANVAYKLLARLGNAQAIGPILLGMGAPVHVLQQGDDVDDIVHIAAVAVMDAVDRK